jgi:hypothetical protein
MKKYYLTSLFLLTFLFSLMLLFPVSNSADEDWCKCYGGAGDGMDGICLPVHDCEVEKGGDCGEACSAYVLPEDLVPTEIPNPTTLENLGQLIEKASGVVTPLAVVGFIFSVIYAGFVRMTAAGNAEKEAKSMKIAIAAAIGFAIMALAPLLVKVLASFLNVDQDLVT